MSPFKFGAVALFAGALIQPAGAQLLEHKDISAEMAVTIATTAIATCKANGYAVSSTVVGRNGEVIAQIRGDNTGPHTVENSFRKAYTARTFRVPSGDLVTRLKNDPSLRPDPPHQCHCQSGRAPDQDRRPGDRSSRCIRRAGRRER